MSTLINLVATRSKDGDHDALFRWYSDHVHLLLGFAALQSATLYRRVAQAQAGEPEYLCLYEFPGHADFLAFESSPARARAQQVVQSGWARNGIEIMQRTQYFRLGRRRGVVSDAGDGLVHHVQSLALGAGPLPDVARWLADRVHASLGAVGCGDVAWHRACDASSAGGAALVVAQAPSGAAAGGPLLTQSAGWVDDDATGDAVGQRPQEVALLWEGAYRRLCTWAH